MGLDAKCARLGHKVRMTRIYFNPRKQSYSVYCCRCRRKIVDIPKNGEMSHEELGLQILKALMPDVQEETAV